MPRLSQLFMPREREFYDLFEEAAANIVRAAAMLEEMLEAWPEKSELAREILIAEQEGDRITHDIIHKLYGTFVTPIDREDILALASGLDDILDFTEEVADFLGLYRIEAPMDQAIELARVLREALASLFERGIDPMMVIRWKDIFERLEDAIDSTETAANILEGIVIKNA